jgi:hypothetical protein
MVFLTVYALVATGAQSWRLRTMYQKIARVLDAKNSVVFLKNSDGSSDGEGNSNEFIYFSGCWVTFPHSPGCCRYNSGLSFVLSLRQLRRSLRRRLLLVQRSFPGNLRVTQAADLSQSLHHIPPAAELDSLQVLARRCRRER